ncbi:neutral protease 2 [Coccidioides immitis RMSCC 3703]|uniref:Neutral protease 2 n=1 Tax=Coccidioides immitis RMSCC 3703 TaxID=454286 RepID=A0A0J8TSQ4_COCIT|nr:neutral protease 2 [Coccidioides immitis RMSCC 3703]
MVSLFFLGKNTLDRVSSHGYMKILRDPEEAASSAFPHAAREASKDDANVSVQLSAVGNTMVKAVVTNRGDEAISVLRLNSVLDSFPCRRVDVYKEGKKMEFEGLLAHHDMQNLPDDVFATLNPGDFAENTFDIAETVDLSAGGPVTVLSEGVFLLARSDSTSISGMVQYRSNELKIDVDGVLAAKVESAGGLRRRNLDKRTSFYLDTCTPAAMKNLTALLRSTTDYADAGARAATNGSLATFETFFKKTDLRTRRPVASRFRAISNETSIIDGGIVRLTCSDDFCKGTINAIADSWISFITICPRFFWAYPPTSPECHATDQTSILLHEMTHMRHVYSPGTNDFAYGYDNVTKLPADQAINNADTFAIYAAASSIPGLIYFHRFLPWMLNGKVIEYTVIVL